MFQKLRRLTVSDDIIAWVFDFLTNRLQFVELQGVRSRMLITNTGAPQGCVLSPVLYTLYTNDFTCHYPNTHLIKFADDSVIQGLIGLQESNYLACIEEFILWCSNNFLLLNVDKTKEMIFYFRQTRTEVLPIEIKDQNVQIVHHYKYLGMTIDDKLNWHEHIKIAYKKANQRMYFLRKLRSLNISTDLLLTFYTATIQSIITFGITCWGGNTTSKDKRKLDTLIRKAQRITTYNLPTIEELYTKMCLDKAKKIIDNNNHPLCKEYKQSVRSDRLLSKYARTERYKRSFVPTSVRILQQQNK